jgi:hypothetical protein
MDPDDGSTLATLESTERELFEPSEPSANDGPAVVLTPLVARVLPTLTAHLLERHPTVPAEVVEHHVHAAAVRLTREARIHDYLAILIERTASESLERRRA